MTETVPQIQGEVVEPKPRKRGNGRAVARVEEAPAPAPVSQGDAFLQMIERAARDPSVDIDKMERLFQMHERARAQNAKAAYFAAFAAMQPDLPVIDKKGVIERKDKEDGSSNNKSTPKKQRYALWEDINEAIIPVLAKHGFSLSHRIEQPTPDRLSVTTILGHSEGHSEQTSISLPFDGSGGKNNMHGWGSAASYGKRYTSLAILPITARGEDDDANAAGAPEPITDAQCRTILDKIAETESDLAKFIAYFKIEDVAKLPAKQYEHAMSLLSQKGRK